MIKKYCDCCKKEIKEFFMIEIKIFREDTEKELSSAGDIFPIENLQLCFKCINKYRKKIGQQKFLENE